MVGQILKYTSMMLSFLMICGLIMAGIHGVELEFDSQGGHEFYLGERLTLTCRATDVTDTVQLVVRLNTADERYQGCQYNPYNDIPWVDYTSPPDLGLIPLSNLITPKCRSVGSLSGFYYIMSGVITEELREYQGSAFYCQSRHGERVDTNCQPRHGERVDINSTSSPVIDINSTNSLIIGDLKVAPRDLTLNVTTDPVVEGGEFSFECKSSSNSSSVYKYEVVKANGAVIEANTYTPSSADRRSLTVRCTDETHPHWRGGNTEKSQAVRPHYIDLNGKDTTFQFNPLVKQILTCNVSGYPAPEFSWEGPGQVTNEMSNVLTLKLNRSKAGTTEKFICTASASGTLEQIKFTINWDSYKLSLTDIYAISGSVGAVVLLVIIAIVVGVVWKRRQARAADSNQRNGTAGSHTTPAAGSTAFDMSAP